MLGKGFNHAMLAALPLLPMALLLTSFQPAVTHGGLYPTTNQSAAFLDGNIVTISYVKGYFCSPPLTKSYPNISQSIVNVTQCGIVSPTSLASTLPIWAISPAFAGYTVYGNISSTTTPDGFPIYGNSVIITNCGAGASLSACPLSPPYRYNSNNFKIEQAIGVYNGTDGLPEGLLPMPAHDYILFNSYGGAPLPVYIVFVRVFDPNIYPNATTGKCTKIAPSNLSNPIGNCLTSFDALRRASETKNSYVPIINANNIAWQTESNSPTQVVIALEKNVTGISNLLYPNSNIYLFVKVNQTNFYQNNLQAIRRAQVAANSGALVLLLGVIVALVAIANASRIMIGLRRERKGSDKAKK